MLKALVPTVVLLIAAPGAVSAEMASKEVHRTVALDQDGRVSIDTFKGSVLVTAWDRAEVEVTARIVADEVCGNAKYQARMVKDTEVRISGEGRSLSLRSDYDSVDDINSWSFWPFGSCSARPFVHYTIAMPRHARLDIRDHKSRIEAAGLASDVRIETHKGEVNLTDMTGRVNCETHKGEVRVGFASMSGDSTFETHSGDIEITMPKEAHFALSADVGRRGRLHSDFPITTTVSRGNRDERLEAAVNGGGPALRLTTHSGNFRLRSS